MTSDMAADTVLRGELRALGRADGIASIQRLKGGVIAEAGLVTYADGTRVARASRRNHSPAGAGIGAPPYRQVVS
jgi:hypothetical protein